VAPNIRHPRKPSVNPDLYISVEAPTLYYKVQKSLQDEGVFFVDPKTGEIITGQINLHSLGMTLFPKMQIKKPAFGFVAIHNKEEVLVDNPDKQTIEAFFSAHISEDPNAPLMIVIQVVDDSNIEDWYEIVRKAGSQFVKRDKKGIFTTVVFVITSLCVPDTDDPDSAVNAIMNDMTSYFNPPKEDTYAFSHALIYPRDNDMYDEEDDE